MAGSSIQRELAILLTGKDVSASRSVRGVSRELKTLGHVSRGTTKAIGNIERGVVIGATAAVGAIGYAVKAAMDWESAFAGVAKTIDGDVTQIGTDIRKMATEIPVAATELAAIAEAAGALGVAKADITEFTRTVAILAVTTDLTSSSAADALGHLRTNLRLTGDDFTHLGNAVVYLGNNGASTESQILGMTESISGASKIVGLSTQATLGWAAALANTGEEIEAGGTSLQKFFLQSFKMVNKGGAKLRLFAKVTGQTAAGFKKSFQKDASGALANFIVKLGKLSKAEQAATLEKLGFTDIRITRALLKLLGNTDNLTDSLAGAEKGWKDNSAATIESEKRFKTTTAQLQLLKNNINEAAITIGAELLPQIRELADQGVDWLQAHPEEIAQFSRDLARGIREAVTWAQKLDWQAIGTGVQVAADAAKTLVQAFAGLPPEVIAFLATGFAANKFTGGAVMDITGDLTKGIFGQFFARGAPGNPMWVASAQGGVPGAGGAGGAGGALGLGSKLFIGAGIAAGLAYVASVTIPEAAGRFQREGVGPHDQSTNLRILGTAAGAAAAAALLTNRSPAGVLSNPNGEDRNSMNRMGHTLTEFSDRATSRLDALTVAEAATQTAVATGAAGVAAAIAAKDLSVSFHSTTNVNLDARRIAAAVYQVTHAGQIGGK